MSVTPRTKHFGATREKRVVGRGPHVFLEDGLVETGPAGAGLELVLGAKQVKAAADTLVNARLVIVPVLAGKGAFCALFAGDLELLRVEQLLPFFLGFNDFIFHVPGLRRG